VLNEIDRGLERQFGEKEDRLADSQGGTTREGGDRKTNAKENAQKAHSGRSRW
jgi:hypothetical protein